MIMGSLRISAVIVSMGLVLIGSATAHGETYSIDLGTDFRWSLDPYRIEIGDFDGDGSEDIFSPWPDYEVNNILPDLAQYIAGPFRPGIQPLVTPATASRVGWGAHNYTFAGDFNGDGTDEIVTFDGGTGRFMPQFNETWKRSEFSVDNTWGAGNYTFAGDFNGDGIDDIASAYGSTVFMKLGSSGNICIDLLFPSINRYCELFTSRNVFTSTAWYGATNQWGHGAYTFAGDFNGDGRADLASVYGTNAYMKLSTGARFMSTTWPIQGTWGGSGFTFVGDFNGDGLDDIATGIGNRAYLKYSTGSGFRYGGSQVVGGSWGGGAAHTWVIRNRFSGKDEIATAVGTTIYFTGFEDTSGGGGGGGGGGGPGDRCDPLCR